MADIDLGGLLDDLGDAVLACDAAGRVAYANAAAGPLLGWDPAELVGRPLADLVPPRLREAGHPLLGRGPVGDAGRVPLVRRDGAEVEAEARLSRNGAADGLVVVLRRPADREREATVARYFQATTRAAARLGTRPDREGVPDTIVATLVADYDAALARVWLVEPATGALVLRASAGLTRATDDPRARIDPAASDVPVAEVARTGRPVVRHDLAAGAGLGLDPDRVAREGLAALAAFPLATAGELRGVLVHVARRPLPPEVVDALAAFAAIAAATLNDAQLLAREQAARVEAEDQRRRVQAILDTISVGVLLAEGPEGRLALVNSAAEQIVGEPIVADSIEEFIARYPVHDIDGRPRPAEERPIWRTLRDGERTQGTFRYRRSDGREVVLEMVTSPFSGPGGGAVSTFTDVTERLRLELELAERAAQFKALLDHLPVGVAYFDADGACRACNGPAQRFLGRSRREIVGATGDELFAQADHLREALLRCVRDQAPHAADGVPWPGRSVDDSSRFLDWRFEPLPSDPQRPRGALALIVDVTDRTRAEVELQRAMLAAEQASRNKTQFLSAVSHDLRTPVNALSLQAELLGHLVAESCDEGHELARLARDIRTAAGSLIELINDLLDLTRFDSGAVEHHPTEFDLADWLGRTLAPLEVMARDKGLEFSWSIDRPGRVVRADRVKLARVLVNLAGNAVKFTEAGAVSVRAGADNEGCLVLAVRDTGPGIPADQLERIFDEFAQLRNPERDRTKGTGLGLAICRRLVMSVGGYLTVQSRPGHGSLFRAVYPPGHLIDAPSPPVSSSEAAYRPAAAGAPILLVEDDPHSRNALTRLLNHAGYQVEPAADGRAALAALDRVRPALVLLDMMMPGMDGSEVLRRLRLRPDGREVPVVILTGDVMGGRTGEMAALDVAGLLAKPVEFDELLKVVARHVASEPAR